MQKKKLTTITGHVIADILLEQIAYILKNMDKHPKYGTMLGSGKFNLVAEEMFPHLNLHLDKRHRDTYVLNSLQESQRVFLKILETYDPDYP